MFSKTQLRFKLCLTAIDSIEDLNRRVNRVICLHVVTWFYVILSLSLCLSARFVCGPINELFSCIKVGWTCAPSFVPRQMRQMQQATTIAFTPLKLIRRRRIVLKVQEREREWADGVIFMGERARDSPLFIAVHNRLSLLLHAIRPIDCVRPSR